MTMTKDDIVKGAGTFASREVVRANIAKAGLPVPPKPDDAVKGIDLFTEWERMKGRYGGVANIPFSDLGDFLDRWTTMISYARWVEAVADIDQATAREVRDTIKKQLYTVQDGSREIRDASVHIEPIYISWVHKYVDNLSMWISVKALREGYEHRANAISREITRRGADVVDTRRGMNRGQTS